MRKLYFKNDVGIDFQLEKEVLISSIEGLGIIKENVYLGYGSKSSNFSSTTPISQITLGLVFMKGYVGYLEFVDYIKKSNRLRLYYQAVDEKYCFVEMSGLTKGQLEFGVLKSELRLDKLTGWLKMREVEINVSASSETKTYQYAYPYTYDASSNGEIRIINYGHNEAEMIIKLVGKVFEPILKIMQFGSVIQTLRLLTSGTGTYEISSVSNDAYIKKDNQSIYEEQDFTCTNFLKLPLGESVIYFESGVSEPTQCYLTIFEAYEAN